MEAQLRSEKDFIEVGFIHLLKLFELWIYDYFVTKFT